MERVHPWLYYAINKLSIALYLVKVLHLVSISEPGLFVLARLDDKNLVVCEHLGESVGEDLAHLNVELVHLQQIQSVIIHPPTHVPSRLTKPGHWKPATSPWCRTRKKVFDPFFLWKLWSREISLSLSLSLFPSIYFSISLSLCLIWCLKIHHVGKKQQHINHVFCSV